MEWLESLFPLLLLLIYFLARARKRAAKRQAAAAETPTAETPGVQQPKRPTPFQEILRQIQEAAEQPQAEKARAEQQEQASGAPNTVVATSSPEVVLPQPPPAPSLDKPDFHKQGEFEHDEHGFGAENPFSEERFEIQPASPPPPAHAPGHLDYDPHESLGRTSAPSIQGRKPHPLVKSLQNSSGLKEALILKEILDPPRSLRRAPRRRGLPRT